MKSNLKISVFLMVLIVINLACGSITVKRGSGDLISESRNVSGFDRVDLQGSGELIIIQDGTESLTVETDDNLMQYVKTEVKGNQLTLGFDTEGINAISPTKLEYVLHIKELESISISGSGEIHSADLDSDQLTINVSGSGKGNFDDLVTEKFTLTISGSGEFLISGETDNQIIDISGSGEYNADDFKSAQADVDISGSGDAVLWVTESLDATVSGSGSVSYFGSPKTNFSGSGSGNLKGLGDK